MPPKYYADVCAQQAVAVPDYSDYEGFEVKFQAQDNYEIIKKIGRGKYSEVYEGINTLTNQRIVIKILKPGKYKITIFKSYIYSNSNHFWNNSQEEQDSKRDQDLVNPARRYKHR